MSAARDPMVRTVPAGGEVVDRRGAPGRELGADLGGNRGPILRSVEAGDPGSTAIGFSVDIDLPTKALSPNVVHKHWAAKRRAAKAYREACAWTYAAARPRGWERHGRFVVDVQYRVHQGIAPEGTPDMRRPYHPKDEDNARAALKAAFDALRDAGVIQTDAKDSLRWGEFELLTTERDVKRTGRKPGITITVRRDHEGP